MDVSASLIKKNVVLEKRFSPMTPTITADKRKLTQVLYNLIGNAAKFTHKGSIMVEVKPDAEGQEVRHAWETLGSRLGSRPMSLGVELDGCMSQDSFLIYRKKKHPGVSIEPGAWLEWMPQQLATELDEAFIRPPGNE